MTTSANQSAIETMKYLLPYLRELDRIESHWNRGNPTAVPNAKVCINNVRNALIAAGVEA